MIILLGILILSVALLFVAMAFYLFFECFYIYNDIKIDRLGFVRFNEDKK